MNKASFSPCGPKHLSAIDNGVEYVVAKADFTDDTDIFANKVAAAFKEKEDEIRHFLTNSPAFLSKLNKVSPESAYRQLFYPQIHLFPDDGGVLMWLGCEFDDSLLVSVEFDRAMEELVSVSFG